MTNRQIIKAEAARLGQIVRFKRNGEVHFFGPMPNATVTDWWLFAQSVDEAVRLVSMSK